MANINTLQIRPNAQSPWTPIPVIIRSGEGSDVGFDEIDTTTLKIQNRVLSVNTTDVVEAGNNQPITSTGVQTVVGNIETLLSLI